MDNLVDPAGLAARTDDPDLRIIDARHDLAEPAAGRAAFRRGHIPGAVHLDLVSDLSGTPGRHGGRHPLPEPAKLAEVFGRAGIGPGSRVVAHDDGGGMFAARVWWLLRWLGFADVQVLDGGFSAWTAAGLPVTTEITVPVPAHFEARVQERMVAGYGDVLAAVREGGTVLIDARTPERYRGEVAQLDPVPGRIPGAVNRPWPDNYDGGRFRSPEELRSLYAPLLGNGDPAIAYCGSGVSAAADLLAIDRAGLPLPRLYAGSFSDWISREDAPLEQG